MFRAALLPAITTGVFCAFFALGVDYLTDMLRQGQVVTISFASGFLGSLFAFFVLGRRR